MDRSSLKNWSTFNDFKFEAVSKIHMAMVYSKWIHGNWTSHTIIIEKDKICIDSLEPLQLNERTVNQKLENVCEKYVKTFAFGFQHILALTETGEVYSWGHNDNGELGNGTNLQHMEPTLVNIPTTADSSSKTCVVDIACGSRHSLAVTEEGKVFAWGHNAWGQLGINNTLNQNLPRQIINLVDKKIVQIACGSCFSMALDDNGEVYGWGHNSVGQLGINTHFNILRYPCRIGSLQKSVIVKIACGYAHTIALTNEGQLYTWGENSYGQLGIGDYMENISNPVMIKHEMGRVSDIAALNSSDISVAVNENGYGYMWGQYGGQNILSPTMTGFLTVHDILAFHDWHKPLFLRNEDMIKYSGVIECLKNAFDDESTSDLTIKVEDELIHVHKAILKIRSAYFKNMFQHNWSENNQSVIEHTEFSCAVFKVFLYYLYTDIVVSDKALELLMLADAYCEDNLKRRCIQVIKENISIANVILLYNTSIRYNAKELENYCFNFAVNHMSKVVQTEDFIKLDANTMSTLIRQAAKAGAFRA